METTPAILAAGVAAGAFVALGLTLVAVVRRRRRDLALLKTLGFTRRQLAECVATQAVIAAVVGMVIGIPLGIIIGRQLWLLFARAIHVVPEPSVPLLAIVLIGAGAIVLAIVAAALPGLKAANTSAGVSLRAE
jgi:ABC-type lipoprotein release transport system permease subunit